MNPMFAKKKIGVLAGGLSPEREISRKSGTAIAKALASLGYNASLVEADRTLATKLLAEKIEVAFVALHGPMGEDGTVQGMLELLGIPYTGSGVLASALGMDKILAQRVFTQAGLGTPRFTTITVQPGAPLPSSLDPLFISDNVVVKPAAGGSTIGVSVVRNRDAQKLRDAIGHAAQFDAHVIIEEFIAGTEITVAVLDGAALPIVEIVPPGDGFFDYDAKYTYAHGKTQYIVPARIGAQSTALAQKIAEEAFKLLGCKGCARADFIVDAAGQPRLLEINTFPGMTETSLVPKAAAHAGLSFETVVERLLASASLNVAGNTP